MKLKIQLDEGAVYPYKSHPTDAGLDLATMDDEVIRYHAVKMLDTGVHVQIPEGYVGLVCERSSLHQRGLELANSVGVIDCGYTGSIKLPLYNREYDMHLPKHTRVAQLLIVPCVLDVEINQVDKLPESERSNGGFGSTGV